MLVVLLALASCRTEEQSTVKPPTRTETGTETPEIPRKTTEEPSPEENPFSPGPEFGAIGSTAVEQGAKYWAVYLAVGEPGAPELEQATDYLIGLGIESFAGELACDRGGAEALGLSEDLMAVGVYFADRGDAQTFANRLPAPPAGIARVRTYCAD